MNDAHLDDMQLLRVRRGSPDEAETVAVVLALLGVVRRTAPASGDDARPGWLGERAYSPPGAWTSGRDTGWPYLGVD